MSLDWSIETAESYPVEPCSHCGQARPGDRQELFSANITHDLRAMWEDAGVEEALYESEGKRAGDLRETIAAGVRRMAAAPAWFRKYDAPNGWGTYEGLCEFVAEYLRACERWPEANVRTWR